MRGKFINKTGEKYTTNQGYEIEIVEYTRYSKCTIKFENGIILQNIRYDHIKDGSVKNPYHPSVCSIGYLGEGSHKVKIEGKITPSYRTWCGMLRRCYSEKHQLDNPTYIGCKVDKSWHNFQVFGEWFENNKIKNWELDKDILSKGNKIYSPETCCFVPSSINSLFTKTDIKRGNLPIGVSLHREGKYQAKILKNSIQFYLGLYITPEEGFQAYKQAKEDYIKEVADLWKHLISEKVYQALYNYQVEITD